MTSDLEKFKKGDKTPEELGELFGQLVNRSRPIENQVVLDKYNHWADTYEQDILTVSKVPYTAHVDIGLEVTKLLKDNYSARICDLACGTGLIGEQLNKRGYCNIDGIDGSTGMLEIAHRKSIYKNLLLRRIGKKQIDGVKDSTYDLIVSTGSFHPGHLGPDCFEEINRITKPGGHIVILVRSEMIQPEVPETGEFEPKLHRLEEDGLWRLVERRTPPQLPDQHEKVIYIIESLHRKS